MKKIVLACCIALLAFAAKAADGERVTQKKLISKTWQWKDIPEAYYEITFTRDSMFYKVEGPMKDKLQHLNISHAYYLSDTKDSIFNADKINKHKVGRYLIEEKNLPHNKAFVRTILSITDKEFKFDMKM